LPSARQDQHIPLPLEVESQALLVGVAHTADLVISARGLDTGAAGDVGGVLRITKGQDEAGTSRAAWPEQELLYLVKTDGSAKVWERGAGVGVG
jgi:elongator complex protein 6